MLRTLCQNLDFLHQVIILNWFWRFQKIVNSRIWLNYVMSGENIVFLCLFSISLMYQYQWFLKVQWSTLNARCFDGRKNNCCNVSKLVVHALHSNFVMDSLEIWNVMLIFHIKTGGWGNVSWKIKGIFSSWVRFLQAVNHEVSTCKNQNKWNVLSHNNTDGIPI